MAVSESIREILFCGLQKMIFLCLWYSYEVKFNENLFPENHCLETSLLSLYIFWEPLNLELGQTSKIELFTKTVNAFQILAIFVKSAILNVWLNSGCAPVSTAKLH